MMEGRIEELVVRPQTEGVAIEEANQLRFDRGTGKILIPMGGNIVFVDTQQITHIEACNYYALVHQTVKPFLVRKTMEEFEHILPKEHFVRVHRSTILNIGIIEKVFRKGHVIYVRTRIGKAFRVSRHRAPALRERIFRLHSAD